MKIKSVFRQRTPLATTSPVQVGMSTSSGRRYNGGSTDEEYIAAAAKLAAASFGDEAVWGANCTTHLVPEIRESKRVQDSLINAHLLDELDGPEGVLEREYPRARALADKVLRAVQDVERSEDNLALINDELIDQGLAEPEPNAHRRLVWRLTACGVGDLLFIAVVFQVFGISDHQPIPILPVSELQMAASATVFALLYLAHSAGAHLRELTFLLTKPRSA